MINFKKFIGKILNIDRLHHHIDLKKFNYEEKELIKLICYKNQQINLLNYKEKNLYKTINFKFFFKEILQILKKAITSFLISINFFKKQKSVIKDKVDIIFICSIGPLSLKDTIPIINSFSKKIILVDKPYRIFKDYKKIFKNTKIINIRDYFNINDYFLSFVKTIIFLFKFKLFNNGQTYFLENVITTFNFFLRIKIYKNIVKNIQSNKIFIDRGDGQGINFFLTEFKKKSKKNKIFSYGINGLALGNDLISAHYLYSNLDYLFCYGYLDRDFIMNLFKQSKFKLLKHPKKILTVGSVRNYPLKIKNFQKKKGKFKKNFNFLYLKSNPNLYKKIDNECFEKFCLFIRKNFPKSKIYVKERPVGNKNIDISKSNIPLIKKNLINPKNIFTNVNLSPEDTFKNIDFVVGTHTSAMSQAIYFNIPTICLDKQIIISSLSKFFCSIYIESIDQIEDYKNIIIRVGNNKILKNKNKNYMFKNVKKNPYLGMLNIINKVKNN